MSRPSEAEIKIVRKQYGEDSPEMRMLHLAYGPDEEMTFFNRDGEATAIPPEHRDTP